MPPTGSLSVATGLLSGEGKALSLGGTADSIFASCGTGVALASLGNSNASRLPRDVFGVQEDQLNKTKHTILPKVR